MSLVAAAVCPHPPLLVPEVAGAAAPELDELRAACDAAVARLLAAGPDELVVVGAAPATATFDASEHGSLHRYGVDLRVPLWRGDRSDEARLPLSLTLGAWLLRRSGTALPRYAQAVAFGEAAAGCAALGATLVDGGERRIALLVMGDGSACRGERAPGYDDPRAEPYDRGVARALATADVDALRNLDPGLSTELKAAGRAPWQVLAGAVHAAGGHWRGELTHDAAPYGVAYLVASWEPA
ncbi:class III extradiol dioxygenase subunit B-like domain-containing protein [Micromonospora sp. NPDC126480]|uniref:class III extradiol dioxygenase subunit B-like domain-containing protein n=1 Tax=Micromonospora sp. NPDC126480 TaxID=3155312 RepID=UPI0033166CED